MVNRDKLIYIFVTLAVLIAGFFLYRHYSRPVMKPSGAQGQNMAKADLIDFSFNPGKISVANGGDFTIDVMIDPAKHKVSNADLIFSFDQTKMRLTSISQSEKFTQVLFSKTDTEGIASYSAATGFENTIAAKAAFATLHFHALEKADGSTITIDQKKSGIYADDNPGINKLGVSGPATISITDQAK